jgi:tRNA (guanine37-N1)-methyltransferase
MRMTVVTLFPELFGTFADVSFVGRARMQGALVLATKNPRDHGLGKHKSVDDTPYGGGSGMVMRVDVLTAALDAVDVEAGTPAYRVLLTPQGAPFSQGKAKELSERPHVALICGRYEGFDERVRSFVNEEISLGDFVMTGGEVAAMAIIESTIRLLPGVLGNAESTSEESHQGSLLEYAQYTRPAEFRGLGVPDVLKEGHHLKIAAHRKKEREERTLAKRPDLYARYLATKPPEQESKRSRAKKAKARTAGEE